MKKKLTKKQKTWLGIGTGVAVVVGIGAYAYSKYSKLKETKDVGSLLPPGQSAEINKGRVYGFSIKDVEFIDKPYLGKQRAVSLDDVVDAQSAEWGKSSNDGKIRSTLLGTVKEVKDRSGIDLEKAEPWISSDDGYKDFLNSTYYIPEGYTQEDIKSNLAEGFVVRQKLGFFRAFKEGAKYLVGNIPLKIGE